MKEFLNFVQTGDTGKTKVYRVTNLQGVNMCSTPFRTPCMTVNV
jgi:hypothetical protein